jgi:DNA helicase IV
MAEQEIAAEQIFVDRVYRQLEQSTRNAEALAREGHDRGRLGHEGGLVERDAMVFQAAKRIANLNAAHEGLVFGRLDLADRAEDPRYIGRIGLRDENRDTLLIDWRAPAAAVFYQATASESQGVVRRRVLRCSGQTVIGVEDELLATDDDSGLVIVGDGALMAQLTRARDRSMHAIVATIQAEQDKAIRAPSRGVVMISGGPGTGKTVVALHRAAFLLYTDRNRYERGGVLVVGPSGVFMRYIERVLPSLGETAVSLRALGEVVDGVRAGRHDPGRVAEIKGDLRMAELLRRLSRQRVPGAPSEFRVFYRDENLVLDRRSLNDIRRHLLSQGKRNRQLRRVVPALVDALWRKVGGERASEHGKSGFTDFLLGHDGFVDFARAWWPALDATEILGWLQDREMLDRVAEGVLETDERRALVFGEDWSVEDVALLDELRYLVGDVPENNGEEEPDPLAHLVDENFPELSTWSERDISSGPRTTTRTEDDGYAHVLVDEAQDLAPMQWRMIGRRGRTATWTIVGDPAQSSWPDREAAERARDEAIGDKTVHLFHLGTNYRNSKEIYEYAAGYATSVGLAADLPHAVRSTGIAPEERKVEEFAPAIREALQDLRGSLGGTIAVVAARDRLREIRSWLEGWPELAEDRTGGDQARVTVLGGMETKGLEFDGIIVVEQESNTGRAVLYVVLTRATQRLVTLAR